MDKQAGLNRSLGLSLLTFYGLGNILGAGIYVLVGKVVAVSGLYAPLSFLIASLLAAFTAFSYAELSARYPLSAGESVYVHEAFGRRILSMGVGLLIVIAGILSSAAIVQGFVAYLEVFVQPPRAISIILVVMFLAGMAVWGIVESVRAAALFTLLEIAGLLLVLWSGHDVLPTVTERIPDLLPEASTLVWHGIIWGALLAFYAYIGFEDMVNVAEEVKQPSRNMPLAIIFALCISGLLYFLIALVAVLSVSPDKLAGSEAPLALIYEHNTGKAPIVISLIGLFAVINGALIQIIMVARILYGLSSQGWLPAVVGYVHPRTRTPVYSTLFAAISVMVLSLSFDISELAENTSFVLLIVFVLVNLALLYIKRKQPAPEGVRVFPAWIPLLGLLTSASFVLFKLFK